MCSTNTTTAAGPCLLALTRVSYYAKHAHSSPPTPLSSPSQAHPALHHYLPLYLPAFLGHSAPPTFIHTAPRFVFMLAGWVGKGRGRHGRRDDFAGTTRRGGSILERFSLVKPNTRKTSLSLNHLPASSLRMHTVPVKVFKREA